MTNLIISNQAISTHNGLYSLNDLHKSAGGAKKHQPSNFMANQTTKDLITEIESDNQIAYNTIIGKGKNQGTFVCRELVYAYAMWISAKFHLMVIRAFDSLNTGAIPALERHTISVEQQAAIRQTIARRCRDNSEHYQAVYHALHTEFNIPRYSELLASDFDSAMAFINQVPLNNFADDHNAFWRAVGMVEYKRISREIRELQDLLDAACQRLHRISKTKGLLYDALAEQRTARPDMNQVHAFIERQRLMKQAYL